MFDPPETELSRTVVIPIYQPQLGRPINAIALSTLEGMYTHFEGRTRVCPGACDCRLCDLGRSRRYVGFFAAWTGQRREIVRLTAQAAIRLQCHPPMPGMVYRIESRGSRKPLEVAAIGEARTPDGQTLTPTELLGVLAAIHGLGIVPIGMEYSEAVSMLHDRARSLINRDVPLIV